MDKKSIAIATNLAALKIKILNQNFLFSNNNFGFIAYCVRYNFLRIFKKAQF